MRVISHGGGVQTTALSVLVAQGRVEADAAVFSNVGDDSEHPATLAYVRDVLVSYHDRIGLPFHVVERVRRDGTSETLMGRLTREGSRSTPIPVRMSNGAPGPRSCTVDFKIKVLRRWHREHGATAANPHTVLIGFSTDEMHRAGRKRTSAIEVPEYPLLDLGLDRSACAQLIRDAGLPVPPKSSCYFCPFHSPATWAEMRRDEPDLFWQSVELERLLNERRKILGKDEVYLTRFARPLDEAVTEAQTPLFDTREGWGEDGCDEGVCFV